MPAEWEEHEATWISWPKDPDTFPAGVLPKVEGAYVKMAEALGEGEEVRVLVDDGRAEERVRPLLKEVARVSIHRVQTGAVWVRDSGHPYE